MINCQTQEEIDYYWEKLTADGGQPIECGWLKDKYDLCWQAVPTILWQLFQDKDPARAQRAFRAMMTMKKFDIAKLQQAADGK